MKFDFGISRVDSKFNISSYEKQILCYFQDNEYLLRGHRLPLNSFLACFKSIFRIHTETGNIWTHLLGKSVRVIIYMTSIGQ